MSEPAHHLDIVTQLADGRMTHSLVDHQLRPQETQNFLVVFPGAFNPLHAGHQRIADLAAQRLNCRVAFELSVENVDKPLLASAEVQQRVRQFAATDLVYLTRAATFAEKALLFENACFLVGADTIHRIADPRYYSDQTAERDRAIAQIADRGCSFLVFGRLIDQGFRTLDELDLPESLQAICDGLEEEEFRVDLSSTGLRQRSGQRDAEAANPDYS